jgi:hypothetical protein
MLDLGWDHLEDMDTSRSEYETRLVASRPPWQSAADLATSPVLGGRPQRHGMPGLAVSSMQGLMAGGNDLLPVPDLDGDGAQSASQQKVGAIVGPLQGRDNSAAAHPVQGGTQEVRWELSGS